MIHFDYKRDYCVQGIEQHALSECQHYRWVGAWSCICIATLALFGCTKEPQAVQSEAYILRVYVNDVGDYSDPNSWKHTVVSDKITIQRVSAWVSEYNDELVEINTRASTYSILPTTYLYRADGETFYEYLILSGLHGPGPKATAKLIEIIPQSKIDLLISIFEENGIESDWQLPEDENVVRHRF